MDRLEQYHEVGPEPEPPKMQDPAKQISEMMARLATAVMMMGEMLDAAQRLAAAKIPHNRSKKTKTVMFWEDAWNHFDAVMGSLDFQGVVAHVCQSKITPNKVADIWRALEELEHEIKREKKKIDDQSWANVTPTHQRMAEITAAWNRNREGQKAIEEAESK